MNKLFLFIYKIIPNGLAFAIGFLFLSPPSFALEAWELDQLQGKFGQDVIYGGKNNIWDISAASKYTVGIGPNDDILCTATLISRRVLLTAGHCVLNPFDALFGVKNEFTHAHFIKRAAKNSPQKGKLLIKSMRISKILVQPKWEAFINSRKLSNGGESPNLQVQSDQKNTFVNPAVLADYKKNGGNYYYDMALIVIDKEAPSEFGIASIPLPKTPQIIKSECSYALTGFGIDSSMREDQKDGPRDSKSAFVASTSIRKKPIGMGISGNIATCQGDSGGPLLEFCDNRVTVIGVSSHQDPFETTGPCESGGSVSNYTYVTPHVEWIINNLKKFGGEQNL